MALCFEVKINDEHAVLAGLAGAKVLSAILTFVATRRELNLEVGAMVSNTEHADWITRDLKPGDVITVRIVESNAPAEPVTRRREDPSVLAAQERAHYEHLRRKYEATDAE